MGIVFVWLQKTAVVWEIETGLFLLFFSTCLYVLCFRIYRNALDLQVLFLSSGSHEIKSYILVLRPVSLLVLRTLEDILKKAVSISEPRDYRPSNRNASRDRLRTASTPTSANVKHFLRLLASFSSPRPCHWTCLFFVSATL